MQRRIPPNAAAVLGLLLSGVLIGCAQNDPFGPKEPYDVVYSPFLHAVTAPESVATGDSVDIVVHIRAGGCIQPEPLRNDLVGPRHLRLTVRARERVNVACPAWIHFPAMVARAHLDEPGLWTIDVLGEDTASVSIQVGDAPGRGGIHRVSFEPRSGSGGIPTFVDVWWQNSVPMRDTVAVDPLGHGEYDLRCGLQLYRTLMVPTTSSFFGFAPRPQDCTWTLHSRIFR